MKEVGPLYQKLGAKNGSDGVEVSANDRSNSLIVLSSEPLDASTTATEALFSWET